MSGSQNRDTDSHFFGAGVAVPRYVRLDADEAGAVVGLELTDPGPRPLPPGGDAHDGLTLRRAVQVDTELRLNQAWAAALDVRPMSNARVIRRVAARNIGAEWLLALVYDKSRVTLPRSQRDRGRQPDALREHRERRRRPAWPTGRTHEQQQARCRLLRQVAESYGHRRIHPNCAQVTDSRRLDCVESTFLQLSMECEALKKAHQRARGKPPSGMTKNEAPLLDREGGARLPHAYEAHELPAVEPTSDRLAACHQCGEDWPLWAAAVFDYVDGHEMFLGYACYEHRAELIEAHRSSRR